MTEVPEDNPVILGWDTAPVAGDRVDVHMGPIVAGDPDGARVEVTGDGLHAYDETGTETAHIKGEGGEFVGGSFRTSDHLPGRVELSNTAFVDTGSGALYPGVGITPIDTSSMSHPPGIGPNNKGVMLSGGGDNSGSRTYIFMDPVSGQLIWRKGDDSSSIQAREGEARIRSGGNVGEYSWVNARSGSVELAYVDANNTYFSRIRADPGEAYLFTRAGGVNRYLSVDAGGVWVKTDKSGSWKQYNLEETAQDSGWQSFQASSGIATSGDLAWRNKNGVIYFRGQITGDWEQGYQYVTGALPAEMRPQEIVASMATSTQDPTIFIRVHPSGRIDLRKPVAGSATIYLSAITYPLG